MKKENKEKKENNKIVDRVVEVVLIIIIILLLLHNCELIKKGKKKTPSGNVNIIEIICDDKDKCKKEDSNKKDTTDTTSDNGQENSNVRRVSPAKDGTSDEGNFEVYDDRVVWSNSTEALIFTNPVYTIEGRVAPESSNTYQFVVKNSTNYNIKYDISFTEVNPYNINMKYKLKKNDSYVVSNYVSYDQLNLNDLLISAKSNDTFYLEWKWISSDNDTDAGVAQANYKLSINIEAESV